ncbi:MAG: ATP-dependent Clp protease ATP-binding subunit [Actinomycetota bacterium]|nr:ATP-dependent Clp protease ATP-binding subunit [Actinomycetota bacterium]
MATGGAVPRIDDLIARIAQQRPGSPLDRVESALVAAEGLSSLGDELVTHFVKAARDAGCSWSQIGGRLGVSKQAAQQSYVAPGGRWPFGRKGRASLAHHRWTGRARRVLDHAQDEAAGLSHHYIGTEHLLLGLIAEPEGVAGAVLLALGIDREAVRGGVIEIVGVGADPVVAGKLPFTARAKKVLQLGVREAERLGHDYIGTEHLLLGIVSEGEGLAAQILIERGVDLGRLPAIVLDHLDGSPGNR